MEKETINKSLLIDFDPEKLLQDRLFYVIGNQILFYYQGEVVLTCISDEQDYTEEDYNKLPEGAPYQLINSKLVFMPGPNLTHQEVSMNITLAMGQYVKVNELGKVFSAPTDVRLSEDNVYQPDVLFVAIKRKEILENGKQVDGAPNLTVEISSPATEKKDRNEKLENYGKYEVEEYWIVKLKEKVVEVYHNKNKEMVLVQTAGIGDTIKSIAIEGFELEVSKIFE